MKESINEKLKSARKKKGLLQSDLALRIGISRSAYVKLENDKNPSVTIELGKKISAALDIPFAELFDVCETNNNENNRLEIEMESLKSKIAELQEQLDDKRKILLYFGDTAEYVQLFIKFASQLLINDPEIKGVKALELVNSRIEQEKGRFTYVLTDSGARFHFLTDEEFKLLELTKNKPFSSKI